MKEIHISDVTTFLNCRKLWDYNSPLRKNLQPTTSYRPFLFGRIIHSVLDKYYQINELVRHPSMIADLIAPTLEEIAIEENNEYLVETLDSDYDLICTMLEHYSLWLQEPVIMENWLHDNNFTFDHMELSFQVPLLKSKYYERYNLNADIGGRIDGIITNKQTNETWILEHKTTSNIASYLPTLVRQQQANLYTYAASIILNKPVVGVIYNLLRKKAPTLNSRLKDGSYSQNKATDTSLSYFKYLLQVNYNDLPFTNYSEYLDHLQAREFTDKAYFLRVAIRKNPKDIATWLKEFNSIVDTMTDSDVAIYPTPSDNCNRCMFNAPCLHAFKGNVDDEKALLEFYNVRNYESNPDVLIKSLDQTYSAIEKMGILEYM